MSITTTAVNPTRPQAGAAAGPAVDGGLIFAAALSAAVSERAGQDGNQLPAEAALPVPAISGELGATVARQRLVLFGATAPDGKVAVSTETPKTSAAAPASADGVAANAETIATVTAAASGRHLTPPAARQTAASTAESASEASHVSEAGESLTLPPEHDARLVPNPQSQTLAASLQHPQPPIVVPPASATEPQPSEQHAIGTQSGSPVEAAAPANQQPNAVNVESSAEPRAVEVRRAAGHVSSGAEDRAAASDVPEASGQPPRTSVSSVPTPAEPVPSPGRGTSQTAAPDTAKTDGVTAPAISLRQTETLEATESGVPENPPASASVPAQPAPAPAQYAVAWNTLARADTPTRAPLHTQVAFVAAARSISEAPSDALSGRLTRITDAPASTGTPYSPVAQAPAQTLPVVAPAATAATAAPAPLAPQLFKPIFNLSRLVNGDHTIIVSVTPDNLGPVTVQAHISGKDMRIEMFAPTDGGREAIRGIITELRRDMAQAGISAGIDLSSKNQPDTNSGGNTGGNSGFNQTTDGRESKRDDRTPPESVEPPHVPIRGDLDTALDVLA